MTEGNGRAGCHPCPVCGSTSTTVYVDGPDTPLDASAFGPSRLRVSVGRVLRCKSCGFGFRQARHDPGELADVYRRMDTGTYEAEAAARERMASRHLSIVETDARKGHILDVGCASGSFLLHALRSGWEVTGVEPSETLCAVARKKVEGRGEIHCTTLEQATLHASFDAVTLWDVLEHVSDPVAFLQICGRLLNPGGRIFANVPDLGAPAARILRGRWPLLLPEHLNYFTRPSLALCGERAELRVLRFGRRCIWFSLGYVAYRVAQHGIPGGQIIHKVLSNGFGNLLIPLSAGETYAVWERVA